MQVHSVKGYKKGTEILTLSPNKYKHFKTFADNNFRFDENLRKFSKRLGDTVGKIKLLKMSNFSFLYSIFKRLIQQTYKNTGLFGKCLIKTDVCMYLGFYSQHDTWSSGFLSIATPISQHFHCKYKEISIKRNFFGSKHLMLVHIVSSN